MHGLFFQRNGSILRRWRGTVGKQASNPGPSSRLFMGHKPSTHRSSSPSPRPHVPSFEFAVCTAPQGVRCEHKEVSKVFARKKEVSKVSRFSSICTCIVGIRTTKRETKWRRHENTNGALDHSSRARAHTFLRAQTAAVEKLQTLGQKGSLVLSRVSCMLTRPDRSS